MGSEMCIRDRGLSIELKILGFGKQENYLKKLSSVSAANVTFIKEETEKDVDDFYRSINLFAMPSKSKYFGVEFEGLGLVYLEAASYGLPVIVGASGGAIESRTIGASASSTSMQEMTGTSSSAVSAHDCARPAVLLLFIDNNSWISGCCGCW